MSAEHWQSLIRSLYTDQRWLVATDVLVGADILACQLEAMGASCFGLAARRGTGEILGTPRMSLDIAPEATMMAGIRTGMTALQALPPAVQQAIDDWDPIGRARTIGPLYGTDDPVAKRASFGGRPAPWRDLEDKTRADTIWEATGTPCAPWAVVDASRAAMDAASDRIDLGQGVVWAADNQSGWHGGAAGTFWVTSAEERDAAAAALTASCAQVRIMPFLEGIPCSIHGWVFPDGTVIALRPCEMITLRDRRNFVYAKAATTWDPSTADREAMRATTKRVGAWLRDHVGYRGVFTIDGVMTADGFRPTELNPRYGAAIAVMSGAIGLNLYLLHLATVEGIDADYRPRALQALLLHAADTQRAAAGGLIVDAPQTETRRFAWNWADGGFMDAEDPTTAAVRGRLGPGPTGGFLMFRIEPAQIGVGNPAGPWVARALAHASDTFDLGLPSYTTSKLVR